MFRMKSAPAMMAAAVALGATGTACTVLNDNDDQSEIFAVLNAKVSLLQAIATAEQYTGGQAIEVEVEKDKGMFQFEIETVSKQKVSEVLVDPASGHITEADTEGFFARNFIARFFEDDDEADFARHPVSAVTLAGAIAIAESEVGGKATEAELEVEDGTMYFEVEIAKDNAMHTVAIDPISGQVVRVSPAEEGEHGDD